MSPTTPPAPGALLGYRKNGQPIRLQAGGSEPAPEPGPGAPAEPAPGGPTPPAPDPAAPAPGTTPPGTGDGGSEPQNPRTGDGSQPPAGAGEATSVEDLPTWARKLITDTRREAAGHRAKVGELTAAQTAAQAQHQKTLDGIAQALGLKPEEVTPEQLAAERDNERANAQAAAGNARAAQVELAVFRAAGPLGADGNALLDSRAFVATLAGLDPAAADFGERVKTAIEAAVAGDGRYRQPTAAPAPPVPPAAGSNGQAPAGPAQANPPSSGPGQFTGPPNAPRQWTQEDVDNATPAELDKAIDQGLLATLGVGKRRRPGYGMARR